MLRKLEAGAGNFMHETLKYFNRKVTDFTLEVCQKAFYFQNCRNGIMVLILVIAKRAFGHTEQSLAGTVGLEFREARNGVGLN